MSVPVRAVVGGLVAILLVGTGCTDDDPERLVDRTDVTLDDVSDALGCDDVRSVSYEAFRDYDKPFPYPVVDEGGHDCYRDGGFVGRVHMVPEADARAMFGPRALSGRAPHQPACQGDLLHIIVGDSWSVVTRGDSAADDVRDRTGGHPLALPERTTTLASYLLPCTGVPAEQ